MYNLVLLKYNLQFYNKKYNHRIHFHSSLEMKSNRNLKFLHINGYKTVQSSMNEEIRRWPYFLNRFSHLALSSTTKFLFFCFSFIHDTTLDTNIVVTHGIVVVFTSTQNLTVNVVFMSCLHTLEIVLRRRSVYVCTSMP